MTIKKFSLSREQQQGQGGVQLYSSNQSWTFIFFLQSFFLSLLLFLINTDVLALRMTSLQIPQHVVLNETVRMQCNFNLDEENLYSVKWYKDGHEFYRYVPQDTPSVQTFPLAGVDVNSPDSTEKSVVLNSVDLASSGRYRCEVSAEAPSFQTVSDHADMIVVVLPDKGPLITGGHSKYHVGDVVRMNCTSAPSKPAAILSWFINEEAADSQYLKGPHITNVDSNGLETAVLGLVFRATNRHFKRGDMKLKCLATIATVYYQSNEESVKGQERVLKAPVMESRETRAQSHIRNESINGSTRNPTIKWILLLLFTGTILGR